MLKEENEASFESFGALVGRKKEKKKRDFPDVVDDERCTVLVKNQVEKEPKIKI